MLSLQDLDKDGWGAGFESTSWRTGLIWAAKARIQLQLNLETVSKASLFLFSPCTFQEQCCLGRGKRGCWPPLPPPPPRPPTAACLEKPLGAWLVGIPSIVLGKKEGANRKMRLFQGIDSVTAMVQRGWRLQRGRGKVARIGRGGLRDGCGDLGQAVG